MTFVKNDAGDVAELTLEQGGRTRARESVSRWLEVIKSNAVQRGLSAPREMRRYESEELGQLSASVWL